MTHALREKNKLLARVRRMRGQVEALERALEADAGCAQLLQQIAAVRGAAHGLMAEVLEGHLREHVADAALPPGERMAEVETVLGALRAYMR